MKKYGFIYIWFDKKRKMYYVGCHWGTEDDGYICSSNRMRDAYRRRPNDFKRRIVSKIFDRSLLLDEEHKWLSYIEEAELGKKYYNIRKHKWGHWSTDKAIRLSVGQKISATLKANGSCVGANNYFYGKRPPVTTGMLGKKLSEESRKKISISNTGKKMSDESIAKTAKANSEIMKQKWQDPVYRAMILERRKNSSKKVWTRPEYREKMIASMNDPARKKKNSENIKQLWSTAEYREKNLQSRK